MAPLAPLIHRNVNAKKDLAQCARAFMRSASVKTRVSALVETGWPNQGRARALGMSVVVSAVGKDFIHQAGDSGQVGGSGEKTLRPRRRQFHVHERRQ